MAGSGFGPPRTVCIGGPPATGKTSLARALAPALAAVVLDLDVATGPLTDVVLGLVGAQDLSDPRAADITRDARYATLFDLGIEVVRAGTSAILVAPFSAERDPVRWHERTGALRAFGRVDLVWLALPAAEQARRLAARAADRDVGKRRDIAAYLAGLDTRSPAVAHLLIDASTPIPDQVDAARSYLAR